MHKRINLTIEEDTLAQIDEYANKLGLNRSSFVSMCCLEKIKNDNSFIKSNYKCGIKNFKKENFVRRIEKIILGENR